MRIDSVAFKGIGPFIDEHTIDFSLLGSDALFLIEGPTGAGKSTILDAIAYGIYGEPAASNSDVGRMRSNHLADTDKSWVQVVFTTRNATFRVTRSPEFQREKARGGGFTTEKPTLLVEKLDGSGVFRPVQEQVREGGIYLQEQVGLDRAQFAQTVLLPQGQFDKFLKADTKERQPLLEKIFRTQKYTKIMETLDRRSKDSAAAREEIKHELREALSNLGGAAGLELDEVNELTNLGEVAEKDQELKERISQWLSSAGDQAKAAEEVFQELDNHYKILETALQLRIKENTAQSAYDSAKSAFDELQKEYAEAVTEIKTEHKASLINLGFDLKALSQNLSKERKSAFGASQSLIDLLELEETIEGQESELDEKREELVDLKAEIKKVETFLLSAPKRLTVLSDKLRATQIIANSIDKLERKKAPFDKELEILDQLAELKKNKPSLVNRVNDARALAEKAAATQYSLMMQKLHNAAGNLAKDLKSGEACQVCGSTTHPNKAKLAGAEVTEAELAKASKEVSRTSEAFAAVLQELRALEDQLKPKKNSKARPRAEILKDIKVIEKEIEKAETAEDELEDIESARDEFADEISAVKDELGELKKKQGTLVAETSSQGKSITAAKAKIKAARGAYNTIADRKDALDELVEAIDALDELENDVKEARGAQSTTKATLEELPKNKDFAKVEEAKTNLEKIKPTRDTAIEKNSAERDKVKALTKGLADITKIQKKRRDQISGAESLVNLAKLAKGDNTAKQNLPTYVLQSMFEDVLVAANSRFEKVLEGRYKFETAELQGSMAKRQGLGLAILDQRNSKTINPAALSGGESFCAALSLALGLSDVVRANQGGIAIDTFFIDEGFGSLDPTRLNQVMNMLTQLKAEGRTIGLISHVEDMKEAIAEKITVQPIDQTGSSSLIVNWM